jgi:hypothetical protein
LKGTVDELLPLSPPVSIIDIGMVTEEDTDNMHTTDEEAQVLSDDSSSVQPRE